MPRRRQTTTLDGVFDELKVAPIWGGPALAVILFVVVRYVVPALLPARKPGVDVGDVFRSAAPLMSWVCAGVVIVLWVVAEIWKLRNRRLLDVQTGIKSIKEMSWRDFERLVSEAYRRKGYMAEVVGSDSGDGGVDIRLYGHGERVLVQCKQWKAYKVSVPVVRELLGVVVSEKADRGILVISGRFTPEARTFASQNPRIDLVDGPSLEELVRGVQPVASPAPPPIPHQAEAALSPACPTCGSQMVVRTSRKGRNSGSQFWGCSKYSSGCRGTRDIQS